jgi:outer membrane immunogenic protein
MNKLLISTIAALGLVGTPAFAADMAVKMPVKAPPPAPAPVYSWTGWYVGGNVGGSWGDAGTDIAGNGTTVSSPGTATAITNPPVAFADSGTQRLSGVIGGGQFGYNLQFSPQWVLGFEADIQASSERGSSTLVDPFSGSVCNGSLFIPPGPAVCNSTTTLNGTAVTSLEAKIDWFGTVRARLG